jgi:hypothetical protein
VPLRHKASAPPRVDGSCGPTPRSPLCAPQAAAASRLGSISDSPVQRGS